jgi:hypothetical protein
MQLALRICANSGHSMIHAVTKPWEGEDACAAGMRAARYPSLDRQKVSSPKETKRTLGGGATLAD